MAYCPKQTGSSSTKAKPSPIISSFLELGRRKTVDAAKICGGAENVVKQKPSKHSEMDCSVLLL